MTTAPMVLAATSEYSLALALEDFVPSLLALAGFWFLASVAASVVPTTLTAGRVGAVFIGAGGLAKSSWKLIVVTTGADLTWLESLLFPLMAIGSVILLWALFSALRRRAIIWWPFLAVLVIYAGWCLAVGRLQPIFFLATTGVTLVSVCGAILAGRQREWLPVVLFGVGIAFVACLVPLRGHPEHDTVTFQWIEQSTNTIAQAALLAASWLTLRAYTVRSLINSFMESK